MRSRDNDPDVTFSSFYVYIYRNSFIQLYQLLKFINYLLFLINTLLFTYYTDY